MNYACVEYRLFLCTPNKTEIGEIEYSNLKYSPRFDSYNELDFTLEYYYNGSSMVKNTQFDSIKSAYLIHMKIYSTYDQSLLKEECFSIIQPSDNGLMEFKKEVQCKSYAYACFNSKILRGYGTSASPQTKLLYDNVGSDGIINYMLTRIYSTWTVNYISASLLGIYHTFTFDKNTYTDVFSQLQKDYNCFFIFDTVNNYISIYATDDYGTNTGIVLSDENFIQNIKKEDVSDNIITRLYVFGKNIEVNISRYNITGQNYIDNFDYFLDNGYFSTSLANAYNAYKATVAAQVSTFNGYVVSLDSLTDSLAAKQIELADLMAQKKVLEDATDSIKLTERINNPAYDALYILDVAKQAEIDAKNAEITSVNNSIVAVNVNIDNLNTLLSWESNYTLAQRQELVNFIFEDSLEMNSVTDETQLHNYATQYIALKSQLPISINVDSADLFSLYEMKDVWTNIDIGDFINIDCEKLGYSNYEIRLISYTHDPLNNTLSFNFSNSNELNTSLANLNKIFKLATQSATTLETKKSDFDQYKQDIATLLTTNQTIDSDTNEIVAGNNYINRRGFMGSDIGGSGAIQVLNDKIIFSRDAWQTFFTLLSPNGLYLESNSPISSTPVSATPISRVVITPDYGFQIDQWNNSISNWGNVVYIGTDGQFHIDNGYLDMRKIVDGNEINKILVDPSVGIKISKNTTPLSATPTWFDVFYVNNEGDIQLADENGNGIILDQYGMDTKFLKWFKNMCYNSSFEVFDQSTYLPLYWQGTGVASDSSSWFGDYSCRLVTTNDYIQQKTEAAVNPHFYDDVVLTTHRTRVSFHKKRGAVKIEVFDLDHTSQAYTLRDESGNEATSITYIHNENYIPESYTVSFNHYEFGETTKFIVKFTNVDDTYDAFVDTVIIEPDFTGRRPSFYSDGKYSDGVNGSLQQIVVSATEPTDTNVLWYDIS